MKPITVGIIYFFAVTIFALGPSLTKDSPWTDVFRPFFLLPAIAAGLVALKAYLDPTVRPIRKDDRPARMNERREDSQV